MSYGPLKERLMKLGAAASPLMFPQFRHCCPEHDALAKLAATPHEMAAAVLALIRAVDEFPDECSSPCPADPDCWLANARDRLDALQKAVVR